MEFVSSPRTLLGVLLLAVAMLLSLPGIDVVRAEEPVVNTAADAAICSPTGADLVQELALSREIEALRAELRAKQERDAGAQEARPRQGSPAGGTVVLNTRGYNYGSGAQGSAAHGSAGGGSPADAPPAAPR
jgi:hypothetical protein